MPSPRIVPTGVLGGRPGRDGRDGSNVLPTGEAIADSIKNDETVKASLSASIGEAIQEANVPVLEQIDALRIPVGQVGELQTYSTFAAPRWRAAVRAVLAGTANAQVCVIGDSNTRGGANVGGNWVDRLIELMTTGGVPALPGHALVDASGADPRWTHTGSGWSITGAFGPTGNAYTAPSGASGTIQFTTTHLANKYEVITYNYPSGKGSIPVSVTGIPQTAINGAAEPQGWHRTLFDFSGFDRNMWPVQLSGPTGGDAIVASIEAQDSTRKVVKVSNLGVASKTSNSWANITQSLEYVQFLAPDLTIILLGTNDAIENRSAADWRANIEKIIDAAQVSGDVLLISCLDVEPPSHPELVEQYRALLPAIAAAKDVGVIDAKAYFGAYADRVATGAWYDGVHYSTRGLWILTRMVWNAIRNI